MNQRELIVDILWHTFKDDTYSNLMMRKSLSVLKPEQRPFVTEVVNGVLRNKELLEYQFLDKINEKTTVKNKVIIMAALYERFFLNEKDYVTCNEYVNITKEENKAFVNAILRNTKEFKKADKEYINLSIPEWIYNLISKQYKEESKFIFGNYLKPTKVYYHINNEKASFEDLSRLNINKINDYMFTSDENILRSDEFLRGYFYVQDINSIKIVEALNLQKEDTFLDLCSAPGTKLFNALDYIDEENAYANDIHEHRVELIKNKAKVLGYEKINYLNEDASSLSLDIKFDKILIDAPCSGLGVIRRKPDIKYHIKPTDLDKIESIQTSILDNSVNLLKENGTIVYSTCTLNKKENSKQIEKFLLKHNEFKLEKEETILDPLGDFFYYAVLKR